MQKYVKFDDLKHILDTTKGTTKMAIKGELTEKGYLVDNEFEVYVDTDWLDKTVIAKDVIKLFNKRLEEMVGESVKVFHINRRIK